MDLLLQEKKALVLGGAGGIGQGIARQLTAEGAVVALAGRTAEKLRQAAEKIPNCAGYVVWDVRRPEDAAGKIAEAAELLGGLDVVVNSTGVLTKNDLFDDVFAITPEDWNYVMEINMRGVYFVCQAAARYMIDHSIRGHIVNIASEMAHVPNVNAYGPSKWGVRCITEGLGVALGHKGITVNGISPGPVSTSMLGVEDGSLVESAEHPNGRWAFPDEIGKLAAFLASPLGESIVGECVLCDGGHAIAGMKRLMKD